MTSYIFRGGRFLDPRKSELADGIEVLVEGGRIREVSDAPIRSPSADVIDLKGQTLMPGLIDCHMHMYMNEINIAAMGRVPHTYIAAKAIRVLGDMLMRGFTTVRDVAGGDYGMRRAVSDGLVVSPRLFTSGRALTPTGGHGDFRELTDADAICDCCSALGLMNVVVDGVPECLKAMRAELRKGADHIKIFCSGGIASENDPLDSIQFSTAEIDAITDEAARWGKYVCAHAYGNEAVRRAVEHGVRSIEHGNFIEPETAAVMREKGAFMVPTLITYYMNHKLGAASGKSPRSLEKNEMVLNAGTRSLEIARAAGVPIGYGTDLSMRTQKYQCDGLAIHGEVMPAHEVIRSATIVNAQVVRQEGLIGEIVPDAYADMIVVNGNPYADLGLFKDGGPNLSAIMMGGHFYKNELK